METTNQNNSLSQENRLQRTSPKWGRLIAWTGLILLLVVVGVTLFRNQKGPVAVGEPVPDFTITTFDGQTVTMSELHGKVVVLNFWASWCIPCEQEADELESAWQKYKPGGEVVFLGIAYTDTDRNSREYIDRLNITYLNGPDMGTQISHRYRIKGVPETFIVDQNGILVNYKQGPFTSLGQITSIIDSLLNK